MKFVIIKKNIYIINICSNENKNGKKLNHINHQTKQKNKCSLYSFINNFQKQLWSDIITHIIIQTYYILAQ